LAVSYQLFWVRVPINWQVLQRTPSWGEFKQGIIMKNPPILWKSTGTKWCKVWKW
jgi:hypothetical protein